ncbi:glucose-6-phosphate dehydrogenase [Kocuria tytonicola]|uniref:Glucose-6-phosphate dehydrogenase n=1 Tax=Kocuria tytonicola TaxID=2055946 RepID=A0A3L9LBZ4_9MICC|nr:glucose-6-phosphate dehydrogenase [Kocuria tytonicola]RLY93962.1 glucose-6-phosphate dehydrogenase [Kocuria tytonicola]
MDNIRTLVILGASGDLTARLLLPGLGSLLAMQPEREITVIGSARDDFPGPLGPDDDVRAETWEETVAKAFASVAATGPAVDHTRENTHWVSCDVTEAADLEKLLGDVVGPVCLYFALAPAITKKACAALAELDSLPEDLYLALEKPVGTDLGSARALNAQVSQLVDEEHTFRVDHFLGMPGVLDIVGLRFANRLFEPVWDRRHIESIEIVFDETLALEGRGEFYDSTGAARDMLQSHLLQVMALTMMDPPSRFDAVEVPANTAHILRATRLWDEESATHAAEHPGITPVVRGRYTAGTVGGHEVPDYAREQDVDPNRETETFVQVTLEVDTWRWNGVPVTLRSGKAIGNPAQHIRVTFRRPPHEYAGWPHPTAPNALTVGFEEEHVQLETNVGSPFDSRGMNRLTLSSGVPEPGLTAYGSVMRWILDGDPTFTVRADATEEGWRIINLIQHAYDTCAPLQEYPAGSEGPRPA